MATWERELACAVDAVRAAMELSRRVQDAPGGAGATAKADTSPVTVADFAVQALTCRAIGALFPFDRIVGEESADALRADAGLLARVTQVLGNAAPASVCDWIDRGRGEPGGRFWTLDPIDGTKGFLRRGQFAVALALLVDGRIRVGVLGCPRLPLAGADGDGAPGCLFFATEGRGTEMLDLASGRRTRVHCRGDVPRLAESYDAAHGDAAAQAAVARAAGFVEPGIRIDSQAKYALVSRGDAGALLRLPKPQDPGYRECIWDHAAGCLVVEESGGRVSDAAGLALDFTRGRRLAANQGIVAAAPELHARVIAAIARGRG